VGDRASAGNDFDPAQRGCCIPDRSLTGRRGFVTGPVSTACRLLPRLTVLRLDKHRVFRTIFRLVLLVGVQQREGVLDALLEDVIGELPVGQDAGELQGADH
jgi:hypothetical protein